MAGLGLNTGLRALLSSQFALDTLGHNIANANIAGYSRQRVEMSASIPIEIRGLLIGSGVDANAVRRSVDDLLTKRTLAQVSIGGNLETQLLSMRGLESLFGEPDGDGLGNKLDGFFSRLSDLASAPDDGILRTGAVQSAVALSARFNDLTGNLTNLRVDTAAEVETRVEEVNQLAARLADLNVQISRTNSTGATANDLLDERDRALRSLSRIVDVDVIDAPYGQVRVLVGGNTLVSAGNANRMQVASDPNNEIKLKITGATGYVPVRGGALGGLLELEQSFTSGLERDLDRLARNLILEVNRVHSTGVPTTGPFDSLIGQYAVKDVDGDGRVNDELLSNAGLPFDVTSGTLYVNVTDEATGATAKHRIDVSKTHTTVQQLVDALNAIPGLSSDLDAFGHVRIIADAGKGFDFSRQLVTAPDEAGTFGSGKASLGSATAGPFALADGDTLDLTVDSGGVPVSFSVAFATADFDEISQATAEEMAAVINSDPGAIANGIEATTVNGRLYLQTLIDGDGAEFVLDGGAAATALGWGGLAGTTVQGHDTAAEVTISGIYTGDGSDTFTFRPTMDGTIGSTPGLAVDVFDSAGRLVTSLDLGVNYQPGDVLTIGEGIEVSFGLGDLSATHFDSFSLDVVSDSDTADVLVGLGLNSFFVGSDATTIGVRSDLVADPAGLATSLTGNPGDSTLVLELLDVESIDVAGLEGSSLGQFYGGIIGGLGFQVASTANALDSNDALVNSLDTRRDQISGVNVDEELVQLVQYEQAFAAAAQYISVVNQLGDELLNLI